MFLKMDSLGTYENKSALVDKIAKLESKIKDIDNNLTLFEKTKYNNSIKRGGNSDYNNMRIFNESVENIQLAKLQKKEIETMILEAKTQRHILSEFEKGNLKQKFLVSRSPIVNDSAMAVKTAVHIHNNEGTTTLTVNNIKHPNLLIY